MWYAVLRKRERGIFIGALALRHSSRLDLLLQAGWQEVDVAQIGPGCAGPADVSPSDTSPHPRQTM